ncbi:MAG: shikimate dehydrogenase [Burkholderiales bacterium]
MTDRYALIGNPIAHSRSPEIHAAFARQTGADLRYDLLLAPLDGFGPAVAAFRAAGGRGLNVTLPFKGEAYRLANAATERARAAEAVNTLRFDGARIHGDNTDGVGLVRDLAANLGVGIGGRRILIVGAGGAARGVIEALLAALPAEVVVVNRTGERAAALERQFPGRVQGTGFEALPRHGFDIVINASSAGLAGEAPPLPGSAFADGATAYDMVYGQGETPFLAFAQRSGAARFADGLGMLVEQAAESFFVWRGVRPATAPVLAMLRARQ